MISCFLGFWSKEEEEEEVVVEALPRSRRQGGASLESGVYLEWNPMYDVGRLGSNCIFLVLF